MSNIVQLTVDVAVLRAVSGFNYVSDQTGRYFKKGGGDKKTSVNVNELRFFLQKIYRVIYLSIYLSTQHTTKA